MKNVQGENNKYVVMINGINMEYFYPSYLTKFEPAENVLFIGQKRNWCLLSLSIASYTLYTRAVKLKWKTS